MRCTFFILLLAGLTCAMPLFAQWNESLIADHPGNIRVLCRADFNNDGRDDLLMGSNQYVSWWENTPTTPTHYFRQEPIGAFDYLTTSPIIVAADVNGDGQTDAITTDAAHVRWWSGNGAGAFGAAVSIPSEPLVALWMADLDGDADQDILLVAGQHLYWRKNSGTGQSFSDKILISEYVLGNPVPQCLPLDFDNDGDLDLVYSRNLNGNGLILRENTDGQGTWADPVKLTNNSFNYFFYADYDGDGIKDFFGNHGVNQLGYCPGIPGGTGFGPLQSLVFTNDFIRNMQAFDMNQDGRPEMVMAGEQGLYVFEYFEPGIQTFTRFYEVADFAAMAAVDTDQDGDMDIVTGNRLNGQVIRFNNTGYTDQIEGPVRMNIWALGVSAIAAGDLDGDGDRDVVAGCSYDLGEYKISWFPNDNHRFRREKTFPAGNFNPSSISCLDIDADGDLDVLAGHRPGTVVWYENTDGQGAFDSTHVLGNLSGVMQVLPYDVDLDGDMDILAVSYEDERVVWYRNEDGQGHFSVPIIVDYLLSPRGVAVVDYDQNNLPDLVALGGGPDFVLAYKSLSPGNFASEPVVWSPVSVTLSGFSGNFDMDPWPDLAVMGLSAVRFFRSTNNYQPESFGSFEGGIAMCVANFDQQPGDEIVIATYADTNYVLMYPNLGQGQFGPGVEVVNTQSWSLAAADLNGNGRLDLIYGGDSRLAWKEQAQLTTMQEPAQANGPTYRLWPHPGKDGCFIAALNGPTGDLTIEALDASGRLVFRRQISEGSWLDMGEQAAGWYWLRVYHAQNAVRVLPFFLTR